MGISIQGLGQVHRVEGGLAEVGPAGVRVEDVEEQEVHITALPPTGTVQGLVDADAQQAGVGELGGGLHDRRAACEAPVVSTGSVLVDDHWPAGGGRVGEVPGGGERQPHAVPRVDQGHPVLAERESAA